MLLLNNSSRLPVVYPSSFFLSEPSCVFQVPSSLHLTLLRRTCHYFSHVLSSFNHFCSVCALSFPCLFPYPSLPPPLSLLTHLSLSPVVIFLHSSALSMSFTRNHSLHFANCFPYPALAIVHCSSGLIYSLWHILLPFSNHTTVTRVSSLTIYQGWTYISLLLYSASYISFLLFYDI